MTAEALRLRHKARRNATRIVMLCVAGILFLGAILFGHIALWSFLRDHMARQYVALIFTGVDLLIGIVLAVVAMKSEPGKVEREALAIRERAWEDALASMTISALAMQVARLFMTSRRSR